MQFWEGSAGPGLGALVDRISFSSDDGVPARPVNVPPDGCTDLLLSFEGGQARLQVFGIKSRARRVQNAQPAEQMAIHLRPGTASRIFSVSAAALRDEAVPAEHLWGQQAARVVERAASAPDWKARQALLLEAVSQQLASAGSTTPRLVHGALKEIHRCGGQLRVRELASRLGTTARTLDRMFREHVGLSPKAHSRVVRFQAANRALARGARPTEVAIANGYADQPHMVRELKALGQPA